MKKLLLIGLIFLLVGCASNKFYANDDYLKIKSHNNTYFFNKKTAKLYHKNGKRTNLIGFEISNYLHIYTRNVHYYDIVRIDIDKH